MICPYCNQPAKKITGAQLYRHRSDLAHKKFFRCDPCDAHVGCHPGQGYKPLGRMANPELRKAKQAAHAVFDPIWRSRVKSRSGAYQWLAQQLGIRWEDCHIGEFDVEMCHRVAQICVGAQGTQHQIPGNAWPLSR